MNLKLRMIKTPNGYDISIGNKDNKSRGVSGWKLNEEGVKDMMVQLLGIVAEINTKLNFKEIE